MRLPQRVVRTLTQEDRVRLCKRIREADAMEEVADMLDKDSHRDLYRLIRRYAHNEEYGRVRGRLAEIIVERSIERALRSMQGTGDKEIAFISNYRIRPRGKYRDHGTEIDGIFIFYDKDRFRMLLDTITHHYRTRTTQVLRVNYNGAFTPKTSPPKTAGGGLAKRYI